MKIARFVGSLCLFTVMTGACWAVNVPVTQYANVAPLPGGGLALNQDGEPDGRGAMQINIPIAYTPGDGYASLGAFSGEHVSVYYGNSEQNGTGVLAFGFGKWPRLYASGMAVSSWLADDSKAVSMQLQFIRETERTPAVAVGIQDLLNKEWKEFRHKMNTEVGYYFVATKRLTVAEKPVYASLGYGTGKFLDRPFVGLSYPMNDRLSLAGEYDGYQLNAGVGWRPFGRYSAITVLAGYNGKCGPMVGATGMREMNSAWAVPIGLFLIYQP